MQTKTLKVFLPRETDARWQDPGGTRTSTDFPPKLVMFKSSQVVNVTPEVSSVSQYTAYMQKALLRRPALITFSDRVCQAAHDVPYVASLLEKVLYLTQ